MAGYALLPLPHWVCTVVAVPYGLRPLGCEVRELLRGPLLAGGDADQCGDALALAQHVDARIAPYARMRSLLVLAEAHSGRGDTVAQAAALDELRTLCEQLRAETLSCAVEALSPPAGLTAREVEVLRHIAGGKTIKQVAATLCLSPRTVERHITTIYRKIDARGRAEATAYALRHGLLAFG